MVLLKFDEYGNGCSLLDLDTEGGISDTNIGQNAQFTVSNSNFKENEFNEVAMELDCVVVSLNNLTMNDNSGRMIYANDAYVLLNDIEMKEQIGYNLSSSAENDEADYAVISINGDSNVCIKENSFINNNGLLFYTSDCTTMEFIDNDILAHNGIVFIIEAHSNGTNTTTLIKNAAIVNSTAQTDYALIYLAGDIVNMAMTHLMRATPYRLIGKFMIMKRI